MKQISLCLLVFLCLYFSLSAVDLPVFYRAPLFQGLPKNTKKNWTTRILVRYATGDTIDGFNVGENERRLFSLYGPMDVTHLGHGVENPGSKTKVFWSGCIENELFNGLPVPERDCLPNCLPNKDGLVDICGRFSADQVVIILEQTIFSGFYLQGYIPINKVIVERIQFKNLGKKFVNNVNIDEFLKNDFVTILKENNFKFPQEKKNTNCPPKRNEQFEFRKTRIPDILLSIGWSGEAKKSFGMFRVIRGNLQGGVIIPVGGKKNEDISFAIPLGYNDHWGFNARAWAELGIWDHLELGVIGGVTVFMRDDRTIRMRSDKKQMGWFVFVKGKANVDKGTLWDVQGYVKIADIVKGLSVVLGYSFTHQEATILRVEDDCFLKTCVEQEKARGQFLSRDYVANCDERLKNWEHQTIHFWLEYDASKTLSFFVAPIIRFEYNYIVTGKRSFSTNMFGATLGIQASWSF